MKKRLATEMRAPRGANAAAVLTTVNPIIRGWANYYRGVVSSRIFSSLDNYMWQLNYKWACYVHPNKSRHWVVSRYFGRFNDDRSDRWVFGNPDSGAYMVKFSWTEITRHVLVRGGASPDDPAQARCWAARRRKNKPPLTPGHPGHAAQAARPVPAVRGPAPLRRPGTPQPRRMGTVGPHHPQSDHQTKDRRLRAGRRTGQHHHPTRALLLPAPGNRREGTGTPLRLSRPRGLLEPDARTTRMSGSEGARVHSLEGLGVLRRLSISPSKLIQYPPLRFFHTSPDFGQR